jgi:hypothetical protein
LRALAKVVEMEMEMEMDHTRVVERKTQSHLNFDRQRLLQPGDPRRNDLGRFSAG